MLLKYNISCSDDVDILSHFIQCHLAKLTSDYK